MKKEKKGVGKPTLYKKAMKRHNIHLSDNHVKIAIALSGEISAGIRLALETVAIERGLTKPALDAGESAASTDILQASAESTSQALPKRTQRK